MKRTLPILITVLLALASQAEADESHHAVTVRLNSFTTTVSQIDAAMASYDPLLFAWWQEEKAETVPYITGVVLNLSVASQFPANSPTYTFYVTNASVLLDVAESIIEPWKNFIEPPMEN